MYLPTQFAEKNVETTIGLVNSNPLGMLITGNDARPMVSHLPFMYESCEESSGQLIGHMARENPQWRSILENQQVLVVFNGPHGYVSPQWYSTPGVPTWNYAVVHVLGKATVFEDSAGVEKTLDKLTSHFESRFLNPWRPAFPAEKTKQLLHMIVGIEIDVIHIAGKFKLSQNRSAQEQQHIIHELGTSDHSGDRELAKFMTTYFGANAD